MKERYQQPPQARFNMRLPYTMKEWLENEARTNGRSINAELVELIREAHSRKEKALGTAVESQPNASE